MALIACPECNQSVSEKAESCPHCGNPLKSAPRPSPWGNASSDLARPAVQVVKSAKSRGVYIILGLFFGLLGIHNFYAGRLAVGVAQLLTTAILGWFVIGLFITAIWVIVELFVVKKDGAGDAMA